MTERLGDEDEAVVPAVYETGATALTRDYEILRVQRSLYTALADIVVADSIEQCRSRGEIYQATRAGVLDGAKPVELGNVISDPGLRRSSDDQLTVADLTGVAVQDVQIAKAVYLALEASQAASG